ncbi:MAG: cytochrome c biogenesis protein ResB [Nitrospirota bacterium]
MDTLTEGEGIKDKSNPFSSFIREVINILSSIKLTVYLFITLAVASIIGTLIEQSLSPNEYIKEYGERVYWWFKLFGLTDLYHTGWFSSLLALLCLNSFACLYKRFPPTWRTLRSSKADVSINFFQNLKNNEKLQVKTNLIDTQVNVIETLKKKWYRISLSTSDGNVSIFAAKGMIGRLGAHTAHLSILVIMFGAFIGSFVGFRDFGAALEGETYQISQGDFSLRVDKFWIEYYKNGAVKDFYSKLTIIDNGKEVLEKRIEVNDPLQYKGIWFYQASYGDSWNRIKSARILIKDKETNEVLDDVILEWEKEYIFSDKNLKLKLTNYAADFYFDSEKNMVYSKSSEQNNPAIFLDIYEDNKLKDSQWIFYKYPDLFPEQFDGYDYKIEFIGYVPHKYTGLQIASDPGVNIVWLGSGLLTLGLFLSSFVFHKRIWVKIIPADNGSVIHIGGNTNKNQFDFQKEFKKIIENVKV